MSRDGGRNDGGAAGARWPLGARIAAGALGALSGGLAGQAVRKAARRWGIPAGSMIRVIEITAPVVMSLAAGRLAERGAALRSGGPSRAGDRPLPRRPSATAAGS
ncbi:LigA [Thermomonospora curvata DSM 43183]|uniref:LigA n=2 Tax=Thermomonosporaceae TaxID=2012 RepID=D1ACL1_THECD|nr:LigA [Thermomonospora curvata DSM 43183]PKK12330.1 MAG: hypothetical protein BUE48_018330 [Thermomonospora sp. CIF 1]